MVSKPPVGAFALTPHKICRFSPAWGLNPRLRFVRKWFQSRLLAPLPVFLQETTTETQSLPTRTASQRNRGALV